MRLCPDERTQMGVVPRLRFPEVDAADPPVTLTELLPSALPKQQDV